MSQTFGRQFWQVSGLAFWLRVGAIAASIGILVGAVLLELGNREAALVAAETRAEAMANALAQHGSDTFQIADVALTSISRLIGDETPTTVELEAIRQDMAEHLFRVPRLWSLAYYEQSGWLLATSDRRVVNAANQSRSAIFDQHRRSPGSHLWIGSPMQLDAGGPWLLTASRRVSHADGSFGGVLVATIKAEYFASFYGMFAGDKGSRVLLMSPDGKLLARNPYDPAQIGMDLSDTLIFADIRASPDFGKRRLTSRIDGVERLASYHRIPGQSLILIFSVTRASAIEAWQGGLFARSVVVALLIMIVAFGGWRLAAYAEARLAAEASLLKISRTDALTGLLNRRAFDHVTQMEWLRCVASGKPLSLLMIDVDHFKPFNDLHGHQAGDQCLQILAKAIQNSAHFPRDQVMRYGGEEIAVVLPGTPSNQARLVAERIRRAVEAVRLPFVTTPLPHVTVSIGYATEDGRTRTRAEPEKLLADADRALYAAKVGGRNRVVSGDDLDDALAGATRPSSSKQPPAVTSIEAA